MSRADDIIKAAEEAGKEYAKGKEEIKGIDCAAHYEIGHLHSAIKWLCNEVEYISERLQDEIRLKRESAE